MIFNTFPDPNRSTILPPNYKRGKTVREYVEYYADSQKIKQDEAIQVQGADVVIWNRVFSKRYCTCQGLDSSINNNPAVLEDLRPAVIRQEAELAIEDIKKKSNVFTKTKNKNLNASLHESGLSDLSSLVDTLYDTEDVSSDLVPTHEPKQFKRQNSILEEAFLEQKKNLGVEYSDNVNCPICFGNRHTDAYQPHRGSRIVLDGSDFYPVSTSGAILKKDCFPYLYNFPDSNASVTWTVTLPKYFKALSIKAYNLEHQSTSVKLSFAEIDSESYTPLTLKNLQLRSGQSNKLKIRCETAAEHITANLQDVEVNVSHVELIMLYCDDFDKAELPMLSIPEQMDYQELYLRSRFIMSPRIDNLSRNDLICENKYGLIWQVVDIDKVYTQAGKLLNMRADVRLVQNSEKLYNLSVFARKMNTWQNNL